MSFRCGVDGATLTVCESPFTVAPTADGAHTFKVQATDPAGNVETTVRQRDFTVDTTVPDTSIATGPSGPTKEPTPSFAFGSTKPGSTFACALDGGAAAACDSPFQAPALADGAHTFTVTATDTLGHTDLTPASRTFTVDTTAPQTTIDSGPAGDTTDRRPTFSFHASEAATFKCSLDGGPPVDCDHNFQPAAAQALGAHEFTVVATDVAGNTDPSPAQRNFRVVGEENGKGGGTPPGGGETPQPPPPGKPAPIAANLSLRDSLRHGVLQVRISAAPAATGSVAVTATGRLGRKKLVRHLTLSLHAGVATGTLHLPPGVTQVRLLASYGGDATFAPGTATGTVRQRP